MIKTKDSGYSYIGNIPAKWEVTRNKNVFSCTKELVGNNSNSTQLLSLTTKGVKKKDINNPEGKLPESFDTYQYVKKNDIVMCLFDLDVSAVFSGISPFDGMISPAYRVLTCKNNIVSKFADYWFKYISDGRKFNHYAKNIRYTLNYEDFSSLPIVFPPLEIQYRIADYLDEKCGKIDAIIEKQQAVIEKLKEYKLSIITEAVTKGINLKVKMKKSGDDKIGDIPEYWELKKLKTLIETISKGTTPSTMGCEILNQGEVRFLKAENIQNNHVLKVPEHYIDSTTNDVLKRSKLKTGDILFVIAGATIGKTAIVSEDLLPANTNQAVSFIRLLDISQSKFVWYYLQSYYVRDILNLLSVQSAQPNLSMEDMRNFSVCIPPNNEREQIIKYLDEKCTNIDSIIYRKNEIINKLREYKKSLIYEVVTGKKEV